MPAFPAFVLLAAAVVLALPGLRPRPAVTAAPRSFTNALAAAVVLFAVLPLGAVAAIPRLHGGGQLAVHFENTLIPVSTTVHVNATAAGQAVHLRWRDRAAGTAPGFYRIMRTSNPDGGVGCAGRRNGSSDNCTLYVDPVGTTKGTSFVDHPGRGTAAYSSGHH